MGHRSKNKHKPRHRQHENRPPNLSQGSRKISAGVRVATAYVSAPIAEVAPAIVLPQIDVPPTIA